MLRKLTALFDGAFARDVAEMRGQLEGPLADGLERAGRVLEGALLRAVRTGPDGALFVSTSNGDDDKVLRIDPA